MERFRAGREGTAKAFERAQFQDPEGFAANQALGLGVSLAAPVGVGLNAAKAAWSSRAVPAALRALPANPSLLQRGADAAVRTGRATANLARGSVAATRAGAVGSLPTAGFLAGKDVAEEYTDPNSRMITNLKGNAGAAAENLRRGNNAAAAGSATRAVGEAVLDVGRAALPSIPAGTGDAIASYMGGVWGANPSSIVTGPAQPRAAAATAQPAAQPRVSTPDQAAAFDRQLAMFGQAPGMAQAAPQAPAALKDDLVASLDGLSIRQVLELAKAMPSPGAAPKPPSAKDQMGYQIFNLLNEDLAAVEGNPAATPEQKRAARERYQASLQLMYNTPGGLMTGFDE